jgi:DNA-binding MarR family transcriptional regulator
VVYTGRQLPMVQLPGLDSIEQTCWQEFLDCSTRLLTVLDNRLNAAHGLTLTEVRLLNLLATSRTGSVRKSELCHALMMPPVRLAQMFRHLRPRGLVAQSATPHDRRGIMLSITEMGRSRLLIVRKTLAQEVRTHFLDHMSHQQMIALIDGHLLISTPLKTSLTPVGATEADLTAIE